MRKYLSAKMCIGIMADNQWSVYMIKCKDNRNNACYIGKTNDFKRRKLQHKHLCNNSKTKHYNYKLYQLIREFGGWDAFEMVEIKAGLDADEAKDLEATLFRQLKPYMNTQYPGRTMGQYLEDNKERLAVQQVMKTYNNPEKAKAIWTKNNERRREIINKQMREHYKKNKVEILKKEKTKYKCVCGAYICHRNRKNHNKTQGHKEGVRCFETTLKNIKKDILQL